MGTGFAVNSDVTASPLLVHGLRVKGFHRPERTPRRIRLCPPEPRDRGAASHPLPCMEVLA